MERFMTTAQPTRLQPQQLTPPTGALIEGVDLRQPLEKHVIDEIWKTFLDSGVIFFRNQDLDDAQMEAFVAQFGTPIAEPAADIDTTIVSQTDMSVNKIGTAIWHTDSSFLSEPPSVTALRAARLPAIGGDTMWSSMYHAYETLSLAMQSFLDGLTAMNSIEARERRVD